MICCEILTIYFFYPETQGRTLEELAFCKFFDGFWGLVLTEAVFEDEAFADKATMAVEKQIHGGEVQDENLEEVVEKKPITGEDIVPKSAV
jgi:hypothetical protein